MTIGYVLDDTLDSSDGVQQAMIAIAEKMRSLGHDVHYIVADTKRDDLKNIHSVSKKISLKFNGNSIRTPLPASTKKIKRLMRDVDFDVIHVQMPYSPLLSAKVIRHASKRVSVVGTFHILPYSYMSRLGTRLLGWWLRRPNARIDTVYAVSRPAADFMRDEFGLEGTVLPNPVDYKFFSSYKKDRRNKKLKIVFVGRFEVRKGVKQLVYGYEMLPEFIRKKMSLRMCGKGPLHEELKKYSDANSLDIDFPGFISEEDKAVYLSESDIAVFPSTGGESFGIVLVEAMSAGSGVTLGGDNPGYSSVLHEWPLALFESEHPESIRDKLLDVFNNYESYKQVGSQQYKSSGMYDIDVVVDKLLTKAYQVK